MMNSKINLVMVTNAIKKEPIASEPLWNLKVQSTAYLTEHVFLYSVASLPSPVKYHMHVVAIVAKL